MGSAMIGESFLGQDQFFKAPVFSQDFVPGTWESLDNLPESLEAFQLKNLIIRVPARLDVTSSEKGVSERCFWSMTLKYGP